MDFQKIVTQGYFNDNNRKYLVKYFLREFKKAEKNYFEVDEFFSGCLGIIEKWENDIKGRFFNRKTQLYRMKNHAVNGLINHKNMDGKTLEQNNQELIEYCEHELSAISIHNYAAHLDSLTRGTIAYNMPYNEVLYIKNAILEALNKVLNLSQLNNPSLPEPEPETTEQKIKRLLEPLRGAFDTPNHIDKIISALVKFNDTGELPEKTERKIIQKVNRDFYPGFKQVKNETRLTGPAIASVLVYFICQNNGSGNPIAPGTIETNIKKNYPKL